MLGGVDPITFNTGCSVKSPKLPWSVQLAYTDWTFYLKKLQVLLFAKPGNHRSSRELFIFRFYLNFDFYAFSIFFLLFT